MTSNKLQYFSQNDFSKGIETRQEMLGKGQVLDAQNMWAFLGECGQRPGTIGTRFDTGQQGVVAQSNATTAIHTTSATGIDAVLVPNVSTLNAISFGDYITFHFSSLSASAADISLLNLPHKTVQNVVTKTRATLQVWTTRGWVVIPYETSIYTVGQNQFLYPFGATDTSGAPNFNQPLVFAAPSDVVSVSKTFTTGTYTGYFFRLYLGSATDKTGSPFTAGAVYGTNAASFTFTSKTPLSAVNSAVYSKVPGAFFIKYGAGTLTARMFVQPATTGVPPLLYLTYSNGLQVNCNPQKGVTYNLIYYRADQRYQTARCPPTIAVVPEFNTAFIAYCNLVFEAPLLSSRYDLTTLSTEPLRAAVNTDPLIVGPISVATPAVPYSTDLVPQLSSFPQANLIVYFKDRLWAAGLLDSPNILRWSGSATDRAYNVWPEQSQVPLSTAKDNSEITAIVPMGDNLVVFKKNSIWQMVDNGISDTGPQLALYEPRLVVAGVGTVSHASVQAVNGGLIFLAEDGFYFYDGTPNIKRLSDSIKDYVDDLSPARTPFAVATVWRTKQLYLCAASTQGEAQSNDRIFVFDFQNGGWWIWSGLDVQCWYQQDGVGLKEELYALDGTGRAYQLERWTQTDNGANIDSYVTTARIGFTDLIAKAATDVRVRGINNNPTITLDVIADDFTVLSGAQIVMPKDTEAQYADNVPYTTSTYAPTRRRERKHSIREPGAWFQLKLHKMMKLFGFDLGFNEEGRR